ncbi:MAG: cupin domain-containing protein [Anaerolineae bacterium]|nr:cupin domain-containing protein [Anaerolineae bacterium]
MKAQDEAACEVRPAVVDEATCEWEGWADPARGGVRWRTLFSAGRTPSQALTCGVAEVTTRGPGDSFSTHRHAQAEVYYILSGEGVVTVDGADYPVRAGSAVFIPGDVEHGSWSTGEAPLVLFYVFAVDAFEEVVYIFPSS